MEQPTSIEVQILPLEIFGLILDIDFELKYREISKPICKILDNRYIKYLCDLPIKSSEIEEYSANNDIGMFSEHTISNKPWSFRDYFCYLPPQCGRFIICKKKFHSNGILTNIYHTKPILLELFTTDLYMSMQLTDEVINIDLKCLHQILLKRFYTRIDTKKIQIIKKSVQNKVYETYVRIIKQWSAPQYCMMLYCYLRLNAIILGILDEDLDQIESITGNLRYCMNRMKEIGYLDFNLRMVVKIEEYLQRHLY